MTLTIIQRARNAGANAFTHDFSGGVYSFVNAIVDSVDYGYVDEDILIDYPGRTSDEYEAVRNAVTVVFADYDNEEDESES